MYRHARKVLPLPSNELGATRQGQVLWGQALYFRDAVAELNHNSQSCPWTRKRIFKLASMMELFCLPDCAIELLKIATEKQIITEEIDSLYNLLTPQFYLGKQSFNLSYNNYLKKFKYINA